MGINEIRCAFMDEGWATTFELLIGTAEVSKQKAGSLYKKDTIYSVIRRYIIDADESNNKWTAE